MDSLQVLFDEDQPTDQTLQSYIHLEFEKNNKQPDFNRARQMLSLDNKVFTFPNTSHAWTPSSSPITPKIISSPPPKVPTSIRTHSCCLRGMYCPFSTNLDRKVAFVLDAILDFLIFPPKLRKLKCHQRNKYTRYKSRAFSTSG